ncbi:MAG: aspartate aminotransferase family protein [Alphaproteobacteria bacterium]|nr:aspartate aminotransferase family protein [Alphaproteobacteria bacterium]
MAGPDEGPRPRVEPGGGNSLGVRDRASLIHPYTDLRAHEQAGPLVITGGDGVTVTDDAGNRYIDAMAGLWCASLGFSEPRLAAAAKRQMETLGFYHLFSGKSHAPAIELAERLLAMVPAPFARVFFANSGSEVVDTAIKLAWYANNALGRPAKKKIISRRRAYHGVTIAAASLTHLPVNQTGFDLPLAPMLATDCPHFYREGQPGESEADFTHRLAASLDRLITEQGPETIAAFIAEPVMGAGGVIVPPAGYFQAIQPVLAKHDVWLIADEVICGFGRTGNMFGCETFGIEPDMMVLAKALSAGHAPISALLVSREIYEALADKSAEVGSFGHGFTYSAHPLSAAVALETLKIYAERDILAQVRETAPLLQKGLGALAGHPLVGEVRGIGLIGAVELVADKETRRPFDPPGRIGPAVVRAAQDEGLITRALGDAIAFSPPLIISPAEIDAVLERFGRALDRVAAELASGR